ncbi:MAG TPA: hypothetical protein VFU38_10290 [Candidatus Krumholzibacteria bacterium]|nr:hypothetical protein [Candidatus Krumholzibacteria bacterium]
MTDTIVTALLGGLLAIAGALAAAWYQLRIARRTRMHAVIAEKKVKANAEAYQYLKEIEHSLAQHSDAETLRLMRDRDVWLFANRLFLPGSFPQKWTALRITLQWLAGHGAEGPGDPDHVRALRIKALRLAKEALQEIYHDMGIEEITRAVTERD